MLCLHFVDMTANCRVWYDFLVNRKWACINHWFIIIRNLAVIVFPTLFPPSYIIFYIRTPASSERFTAKNEYKFLPFFFKWEKRDYSKIVLKNTKNVLYFMIFLTYSIFVVISCIILKLFHFSLKNGKNHKSLFQLGVLSKNWPRENTITN